jgi:XTP/dITP diphosphohydrolase
MIDKPRLLIATNNKGKLIELRDLLKSLSVDLHTPADLGISIDIEEDGVTYAENATKKALAFTHASGLVSLADDTGLEVDALGGKPGLHSNRFGPRPYTDATRRAYLLDQLSRFPRPWNAHFRATVAVVSPGGSIETVEGICEGYIFPEERGSGGFGYDPLFLFSEMDLTMAELDMETKNRLSHRGQAVRKAIPIIEKLLGLD